jgi:AcrR family transcriptional regulator
VRVRPTRDETRERLFEAAAQVFEDKGIGAASIAAITDAAGFTRGAFYSNFASKDELIIAMLADHVERSVRRNLELLASHRDPAGFMAALPAADRSQDPLARSPMLHIELILYAARIPQLRPELAKRQRARRALIAQIISSTNEGANYDRPIDTDRLAGILLAIEDGFRLHQLIDPDHAPQDGFIRAVSELQQAMGLDSGARRRDDG